METRDFNQTTSTRPPEGPHERSTQIATAGSIVEAIGGIGAVVLSILGLAGIAPLSLAAVAIIAVGAALLFGAGGLAARYRKVVSHFSTDRTEQAEIGGGVGAEFLVGAAGVVLGVLALLGIAPIVLCSVAVIAFGGGLLLSTGATTGVNEFSEGSTYDRRVRMAREAVQGAAGVQALVGIAAAILGILALLDISPITLVLVALLGLGGGILIAASAVSGRLIVGLRHR